MEYTLNRAIKEIEKQGDNFRDNARDEAFFYSDYDQKRIKKNSPDIHVVRTS